jgi:hypothetical protein
MADVIIDRTGGLGRALVERHMAGTPPRPGPRRLRRAVVLERPPAAGGGALQAIIDAADAMLPADVWPAFVALTLLGETPRGAAPTIVCRRGAFLGILAVGEIGMLFVDGHGRERDPRPAAAWVLGVLDAAHFSARPATLSARLHL